MRIYFARHGESQANLLHIISNRQAAHGLTEAGRVQAARLAEQLDKHPIEKIYSSPILRAVQTASVLADCLKVAWVKEDGLREYDCGIAEDRADAAAWQLWQAEFNAWTIEKNYIYQIEGGESFFDVRKRFTDLINYLILKYGGTPSEVVCISHGGIYRVMLPLIMLNLTSETMVTKGFDYTSYIIAEHTSRGLMCVEWNGMPM